MIDLIVVNYSQVVSKYYFIRLTCITNMKEMYHSSRNLSNSN